MSSIALLRPEPRPEVMAIEAYVPGKSRVAGVAKVHKLSSNESPLGPSPKAIGAFQASARNLAVYPDGSARALREAVGRRSASTLRNPMRKRLGRDSRLAGAGLPASGRRGALQRARVSRISDRHSRGRRDAGRRPGDGQDGRCRRASRQGEPPDADRLSRQSEQPDRDLSALSGDRAAHMRGFRPIVCWCSTRPMPNMSRAMITPPESSSRGRARTSS